MWHWGSLSSVFYCLGVGRSTSQVYTRWWFRRFVPILYLGRSLPTTMFAQMGWNPPTPIPRGWKELCFTPWVNKHLICLHWLMDTLEDVGFPNWAVPGSHPWCAAFSFGCGRAGTLCATWFNLPELRALNVVPPGSWCLQDNLKKARCQYQKTICFVLFTPDVSAEANYFKDESHHCWSTCASGPVCLIVNILRTQHQKD